MCLVHLSRKSVGSRHMSRTAEQWSEEMTEDFLHRGEKSWWWIRLDSRSGYFYKSRFVRRTSEDFCHDLRFPWTFPRERHVRALCTCKVLEKKRCREYAQYIFLGIIQMYHIRLRFVRACVCVCVYVSIKHILCKKNLACEIHIN